jgi:hypothetical protein
VEEWRTTWITWAQSWDSPARVAGTVTRHEPEAYAIYGRVKKMEREDEPERGVNGIWDVRLERRQVTMTEWEETSTDE